MPDDTVGPNCPKCGSAHVAEVLYGLVCLDPELEREIAAGRIVLGGCSASDDSPVWSCNGCGHEWGTFRTRTAK